MNNCFDFIIEKFTILIESKIKYSEESQYIFLKHIKENEENQTIIYLNQLLKIAADKRTFPLLSELLIFINIYYDFENFINNVDIEKNKKIIEDIFFDFQYNFEVSNIIETIVKTEKHTQKKQFFSFLFIVLKNFNVKNYQNEIISIMKRHSLNQNESLNIIDNFFCIDDCPLIIDYFISLKNKKILLMLSKKTNLYYLKTLNALIDLLDFTIIQQGFVFNILNFPTKKEDSLFLKELENEERKIKGECYNKFNLFVCPEYPFSSQKNKKEEPSFGTFIKSLIIKDKNFIISKKKIENNLINDKNNISLLLNIICKMEQLTIKKTKLDSFYIWNSSYLDIYNSNLYTFFSKVLLNFSTQNIKNYEDSIKIIEKSKSLSVKSLLIYFLFENKNKLNLQKKEYFSFLFKNEYFNLDRFRYLYTTDSLLHLKYYFSDIVRYKVNDAGWLFGDRNIHASYYYTNDITYHFGVNSNFSKMRTSDKNLIIKIEKNFFDKEISKKDIKHLLSLDFKIAFSLLINKSKEFKTIKNKKKCFFINIISFLKFLNEKTFFIQHLKKELIFLLSNKNEFLFETLIIFLELNNYDVVEDFINNKLKKSKKINFQTPLIGEQYCFFLLNLLINNTILNLKKNDINALKKLLFNEKNSKLKNRKHFDNIILFLFQNYKEDAVVILRELYKRNIITISQFYSVYGFNQDFVNNNYKCIIINGNNNIVYNNRIF